MNYLTLAFLAAAILMIVSGFYFIYPPLALISGGLISAGLAVLTVEVEEK